MTDVPLRWIDTAGSATADHPTAIGDIFARRLDGLTITDVFTRNEISLALDRLASHPNERTGSMFGTMLGMSLAEIAGHANPGDRTAYLDSVERCRAIYHEAFGFDPHERVAAVVSPLTGGLVVEPPVEGGRSYNPGNVRWFEPGRGGLPAHVGNEFQMHGDVSMAHLRTTTVTLDHLSWFVVLQAPDSGGELSVFDRVVGSHAAADPRWAEHGRDDAEFGLLPARRMALVPGEMVVFGGGWRWHRVEEVRGQRPRITYGGFAGPSIDGRSLHVWF